MNVVELHSKYMRETKKHPINENSKEGAYSDEYVNWLQNIVVNNNDLHLVSNLLTKYIGTVIESEGCDYIPQKGMQKYDTIKISDEEIDILKERSKIFSDC
jgi:hypothetical protein